MPERKPARGVLRSAAASYTSIHTHTHIYMVRRYLSFGAAQRRRESSRVLPVADHTLHETIEDEKAEVLYGLSP